MSFHEQPKQQRLTCQPAPKPADREADLCSVFRGPLSFVAAPSDTLDLLPSEAELITYYEVAHSFDLHVDTDLLQLPVCPFPNVRP